MNLPRGTQIIPHDLSKRMADRAVGGQSVLRVDLAPDLEARILQQAEGQSLSIARSESARTVDNIRRDMQHQPKSDWGLA